MSETINFCLVSTALSVLFASYQVVQGYKGGLTPPTDSTGDNRSANAAAQPERLDGTAEYPQKYDYDNYDDFVATESKDVDRGLQQRRNNLLSDGEMRAIRDDVLNKTNYYRNLHGLSDLIVKQEIQIFAQAWADELIKQTNQSISFNAKNQLYGENIARFSPFKHIGEVVVDYWYYQLRNINGNYTQSVKLSDAIQLLWTKTREIGVGVALNEENKYNIVVDFYPPGNNLDEYKANIPKITREVVDLAKEKWRKIEDEQHTDTTFMTKYTYIDESITGDVRNRSLPGWESMMYTD